MEEELRTTGPVATSITWIQEMEDIKDEIYLGPDDPNAFVPQPDEPPIIHSVLIVGYGTERVGQLDIPYWIIKNSHGTEWGNGGYGRLWPSRPI
ncbi:hypothetical protein TSUD_132930 [Trifolium subterraneum]|uniref:Peptidase C1A papain C-terminal domain-containing protein n=1 Tax=Trifolium subterraneum TaxID=3900 RepID=A0A2Z6LPS5_TRISU|nr:hypothetical protein TSUD_132930 [Trifolium subterraneum]